MRLKLRSRKCTRKGGKSWSIYQVHGTREKLHKRLGPIPKELAETILRKELTNSICIEENIRRNQDVAFEKTCEEYLEFKSKPPNKGLQTYKQNIDSMKQVKRVMAKVFTKKNSRGSAWIHDINLWAIDSYKVVRKEEGVSNRTINIELNLIRGVLKYALERNYIVKFNLAQMKNLPEEEPRREWCKDISEIEGIIAAAKSPFTEIKLRLGFEAGLRSAEILHLTLKGIDLEGRAFTVYGEKENRFKEIPMSYKMAELLSPLMTHRYTPNGMRLLPRAPHQMTYLFCNEQGQPFKSFKKGFRAARERSGIKAKISPHSMRHTFASHLLQNGASAVDVSNMLGHNKVSTTLNIYAHSSQEGRRRALEKLPYLKKGTGNE